VTAFAATLVHGPTDLRGLRRSLISWLEQMNASADVQDAVLLATHEAAANAMQHGEPEGPVTVSAHQDVDGSFSVEVTNHGGWKEPEPGHHGGGLLMMKELMSDVGIRTRTSVLMRHRDRKDGSLVALRDGDGELPGP
jgi:anti-sigma regulatory factor (Ser/Thr protein kinase)